MSEYKCYNKRCSDYDEDYAENCKGYGLVWDGHRCKSAKLEPDLPDFLEENEMEIKD